MELVWLFHSEMSSDFWNVKPRTYSYNPLNGPKTPRIAASCLKMDSAQNKQVPITLHRFTRMTRIWGIMLNEYPRRMGKLPSGHSNVSTF